MLTDKRLKGTNESAKEEKAKTSLERAKEFVIEMKKLVA